MLCPPVQPLALLAEVGDELAAGADVQRVIAPAAVVAEPPLGQLDQAGCWPEAPRPLGAASGAAVNQAGRLGSAPPSTPFGGRFALPPAGWQEVFPLRQGGPRVRALCLGLLLKLQKAGRRSCVRA